MKNDPFDHDDFAEKPSKSQRKRDMDALQSLGESLLSFDPKKLASLNLPQPFMTALIESKKINPRKAGRRHLQYIGRLMRELDEETVAAIKQFLLVRKGGR